MRHRMIQQIMALVRAFLRFARRAGLVPSPLRRPVDRVENLLAAGAVLLILAALPAAFAVGQAEYHNDLAIAATQLAGRTQADATLVQDAPSSAAMPDTLVTSPALAVWALPDGSVHSGQVAATPGAPAGTEVPIWVDVQGRITPAPLTPDQARNRGFVTGFLAESAVIIVLAGLFALLRHQLDRRRWAEWDDEWRTIGPHWTKYRI